MMKRHLAVLTLLIPSFAFAQSAYMHEASLHVGTIDSIGFHFVQKWK